MLREDVRYMAHIDWEPRIPNNDTIREQLTKKPNIAGSVRASLGQIAGYPDRAVCEHGVHSTKK